MNFKCSSMLNKLIFFGNKFCTLQLIFNMFSMPYCEWAIFGICYKNWCFIREITFLQERFVYSTTHSFLWSFNRYWWLLQKCWNDVVACMWLIFKAHPTWQRCTFNVCHLQLYKKISYEDCEVCSVSYCLRVTSNCHKDFSERHIFNVSLSDDIEHIGCVQKQHVLKKISADCRHAGCDVVKWHWLSLWIS